MSRKVVWNACYGGFNLSPLATKMLYERKHPRKTLYVYALTSHYFERKDKKDVYTKVKDLENFKGSIVFYVTKDFGDEVMIPKKEKYDGKKKKFFDKCIFFDNEIERHDPDLVAVVEELGSKRASGYCAELEITDIGDSLYHIDDYDGYESVITSLSDDYWK